MKHTIFKMVIHFVSFLLLFFYVNFCCISDVRGQEHGYEHDKSIGNMGSIDSIDSIDTLYVRVTGYDNGFVLLDDREISCEIIDDDEDVISRSFNGHEAIDRECAFVAGMFTVDVSSGLFLPVRANAIHDEYYKQGYLDYIDVWLCITSDWENATQIYDYQRSYDPESLQSCWFIMNTQTLDAYHVSSNTMYSLKTPRIDVSEAFIVPFYTYDDENESFEILQFKDVFKTNGYDSIWDHGLETRRGREL